MSKFKIGDTVVIIAHWHKTHEPYTIVKPFYNSTGWILSNGIAYAEDVLELEHVFNSPLYKALL